MRQADLERTLRTILEDLAPYRSDLILIGGWVPYLYRHYGGFASWGGEDTLTFELDVLVSRPLPSAGRPCLAEVLYDAGFRPLDDKPPAAVWVRDGDAGEKIEFITIHRGTAQGQGLVVPLTEQPAMGAIPLTELEVIRNHVRTLLLPPLSGLARWKCRFPPWAPTWSTRHLPFFGAARAWMRRECPSWRRTFFTCATLRRLVTT